MTNLRRRFRWRAFPAANWAAQLLGLLLGLSVWPALAAESAAVVDYLPVTAVEPGMTGYGLTVFSGSRIDTFSVKVVGIQHRSRPSGSLIMVEIGGHGLEESSVAQGMSGSPIFLEGKLAGALAFGWPGALRPLGGVTPAGEILALPTRLPPSPPAPGPQAMIDLSILAAASAGGLARDLFGSLAGAQAYPAPLAAAGQDYRHLAAGMLWPEPGDLIVPLLAGTVPGLQAETLQPQSWVIQPLGGDSGPGSGAAAATARTVDPAARLAPGSACGVPLVMGDAILGVTGTVTWVQGDQVYMMGHPFLQRGPVSLPLATAEVLTVFPSRQMSFKMASVGVMVGTVHYDQRAGLSGRLGPGPDLIPVTVEIVASPESPQETAPQDHSFSVVADPMLTPPLVFWCLYNSLLVSGDDQSQQTVRYEVTTSWSGSKALADRPLVLAGVVAGPGGVQSLAGEWMAPLSILLNNPYEPVQLREVKARLVLSRPMETETIAGLAGPRVLTAGQTATFRVELQSRHAAPEFIDFDLTIPAQTQPGNYRLAAASAAEFFALEAQRAAGRFQMSSLGGALDLLRMDRSQATLVLALLAPGEGLVMRGRELAGLPDTVARLLKSADPEAAPTLADFVVRQDKSLGRVLQGHAIQSIQIRPAADPSPVSDRP